MAKTTTKRPVCIVIAGPNGAGKTTFAREFLLKDTRVIHFVNADLIASGLSPLRPQMAALAAGRIFLRELDRLAKSRAYFAFESTLSGLVYVHRLKRGKSLVTGLKLFIFDYGRHSSRFGASRRRSSRRSSSSACTTRIGA